MLKVTKHLIFKFYYLQRLWGKFGCVHNSVSLLFASVHRHCSGWNHFHDGGYYRWKISRSLSSIVKSTKSKIMVLCCSSCPLFCIAQRPKISGNQPLIFSKYLFNLNSCDTILFYFQEIKLEWYCGKPNENGTMVQVWYNDTAKLPLTQCEMVSDTENVPTVDVTALRKNDDYIRGYLMWTRLFTTAIIPVTLLLILNVLIIRDVITSAKKVNRYVDCFAF